VSQNLHKGLEIQRIIWNNLGSCPVAGFDVSDLELSNYADTKFIVAFLSNSRTTANFPLCLNNSQSQMNNKTTQLKFRILISKHIGFIAVFLRLKLMNLH
jgi:hypothetical protein